MTQTILQKIQVIVARQLEIEESRIIPEAHFEDDLGADSLDLVELVMSIEEEFDLDIDDGAASQIETVQDVLNYISTQSSN